MLCCVGGTRDAFKGCDAKAKEAEKTVARCAEELMGLLRQIRAESRGEVFRGNSEDSLIVNNSEEIVYENGKLQNRMIYF